MLAAIFSLFRTQRLKSAEFCVKLYRQPTNIDKGRQISAKSDRHRQHPIQQSPQARHRTLLASTNGDKARQKQNRHPSTAIFFARFAFRQKPTSIDKMRQRPRKNARQTLAFLPQIEILGIFSLTLSVVFVDVLWSEILSFSEIVRQAKTTTKGMPHGDKNAERRGDIVRKPNKNLHKNLQFSAVGLSLCDKKI